MPDHATGYRNHRISKLSPQPLTSSSHSPSLSPPRPSSYRSCRLPPPFPSFFPSLKTRSIHVIIGLSPAAERNRGSIAVSSQRYRSNLKLAFSLFSARAIGSFARNGDRRIAGQPGGVSLTIASTAGPLSPLTQHRFIKFSPLPLLRFVGVGKSRSLKLQINFSPFLTRPCPR